MRRFLLTLILLCFASLPASAVQVCDNAWFTTATAGTGTITSSGAVSGAQTMLQCGLTDGQVTRYRIFDGAAYEVGSGTVGGTSTTLTRVVTESSNADAAISLSGTATVIVTVLKADLPTETTPIEASPATGDHLFMLQGGVLERSTIASTQALLDATTTEQETGTSATVNSTPNSVAALWEKGADIASSGTIAIGEGYFFHVTGTTTITDIDWTTPKDGRCAILEFDGILTLTHHATTLVLRNGANKVTSAGDIFLVCQDSSDNVHVIDLFENATVNVQTVTATGAGTWTKPTGAQTMCLAQVWGAGGSGGKGAAAAAAAGGGGGSYREKLFAMSSLGATETISVGTGGVGQTTASTDGNVGGNTTFGTAGTLITGWGGGPGNGDGAGGLNQGGNGASHLNAASNAGITVATNAGTIDEELLNVLSIISTYGTRSVIPRTAEAGPNGMNGIISASGGSASDTATLANGNGGHAIYGGAGGGAGAEDSAPGAGTGGNSQQGGNGGAGAFDANAGTAGTQPGGGGGGSETGTSGAGGNGQVTVTCW